MTPPSCSAEAAVRAVHLGIFESVHLDDSKHIYEGTDYKTNPANNTPVGTGPFMFKNGRRARSSGSSRSGLLHQGQTLHRRGLLARHSRRRRAIGGVRDRQGRCAARRLGRKFRRSALEQTQERVRHRQWLEFFSPHSWLWLNNRFRTDGEQIPSGGIRHRPQLCQGRDLERSRQDRNRPIQFSIKYYTDAVSKYDYDPAKARALLSRAVTTARKSGCATAALRRNTWQRWAEEAIKQICRTSASTSTWLRPMSRAGIRKPRTGITTSPSPMSTSMATPPLASLATTSAARSPRDRRSTWRDIQIPKSTSCSPTVQSLSRIRSARKSMPGRKDPDRRRARCMADRIAISHHHALQHQNLITTAIGVNDGFRDAWIDIELLDHQLAAPLPRPSRVETSFEHSGTPHARIHHAEDWKALVVLLAIVVLNFFPDPDGSTAIRLW